MSKVAAAITSPATKAAKQENSTKSLRSIRIRAPSPLLRGLRLASKRLIMAKDRARRHRIEAPWPPYRSGRSRHSIKSKNPAAPAVKREAEEDWGKGR